MSLFKTMLHLFEKSLLLVSVVISIFFIFELDVPSASAAALCVTNPYGWADNYVDQRCAVSLSVTPASSSLSSGGSTNVTLKALGILQYDVYLTDFYAWMVEDSTGISTDLYYTSGVYGITRIINTGALTKSVTVYLFGENTQLMTNMVSAHITVTAPAPPSCAWTQDSYLVTGSSSNKCALPFSYLPSPLPSCTTSNVNQSYVACSGLTQSIAICECDGTPAPTSCPNAAPCGSVGACYAKSGCDLTCGSTKENDCAGTCGGSATDYNGATAGCGAPVAPVVTSMTVDGSTGNLTSCPGVSHTLVWSATNVGGTCGGFGYAPVGASPNAGGSTPFSATSNGTISYNCPNSAGAWGTQRDISVSVVDGSSCCNVGSHLAAGQTYWNGSACVVPAGAPTVTVSWTPSTITAGNSSTLKVTSSDSNATCVGTLTGVSPVGATTLPKPYPWTNTFTFPTAGTETANGYCTNAGGTGYAVPAVLTINSVTAPYVCTGTVPANASMFSNDNVGLATNTPYSYWATDTGTRCQYSCNPTYTWNGSSCIATSFVNGSCSSIPYNCAAGTSGSNVSGVSAYTWTCAGSNGGSTAFCSKPKSGCVPNQGATCSSTGNACGERNYGYLNCAGVCSAITPPDTICGAAPVGQVESVSSGASCGLVSGWTFDSDKSSQSINAKISVHYRNFNDTGVEYPSMPTEYNIGATTEARPDVNTTYGITGVHGFSYQITPTLAPGPYTLSPAYGMGINSSGVQNGYNGALSGQPVSFTCTSPKPIPVTTFTGIYNTQAKQTTLNLPVGGGTVNLNWSVSGGTAGGSCTGYSTTDISGWAVSGTGEKSTTGANVPVSVSTTTHFNLDCWDGSGTPADRKFVQVNVAVPCVPNGCASSTCSSTTCNNGCNVVSGTKSCNVGNFNWVEVAP